MEEEKGQWEEIIRSKMYDFEADTNPDDWDIISDKLSEGNIVMFSPDEAPESDADKGKVVIFNPFRKYAAAAVAAVLLIAGGLYFYPDKDENTDTFAVTDKPTSGIVESTNSTVENLVDKSVEKSVDKPVEKSVENLVAITTGAGSSAKAMNTPNVKDSHISTQKLLNDNNISELLKVPELNIADIEKEIVYAYNELKPDAVTIDKTIVAEASSKEKQRRWGFGMGGGSFAVGSTSGTASVVPYSTELDYDEYMLGNAITLRSSGQPSLYEPLETIRQTALYNNSSGDVNHKMPVSAGLGVSYYLNDRWSLQSGAVYTLLRSNGKFHDNVINNMVDWKQNLHFVGIPLSLNYKIAEWNRFQFYATAGGMAEINVYGKLKNTVNIDNIKVTETENQRMKAPLWSVNTRGGVVYPLCKFINLYAEAGASYYFENNSKIETIRSDKPFNVSLQAGIRLGF